MKRVKEWSRGIGCLGGFIGTALSCVVFCAGIVGWVYSLFHPAELTSWEWISVVGISLICLVAFFILGLVTAPYMV